MTNEQLYTAAWQSLSFIGPSGVRKLVNYFGSAEKAWKTADEEIFNILHHCTEKQLKISQGKKCFDWDRFLTRMNQLNLQIISYHQYFIFLVNLKKIKTKLILKEIIFIL